MPLMDSVSFRALIVIDNFLVNYLGHNLCWALYPGNYHVLKMKSEEKYFLILYEEWKSVITLKYAQIQCSLE